MKRRGSLALLVELSRRERDRVAGIAAQAQRDLDAATKTRRMLGDYRNDYEANAPKGPARHTDALRVRVHEAFVGKLDRAIGEQDALLGHLHGRHEQQRAALSERQRRLKALETLQTRRADEAARRQASNEQKQTDEFAVQAHARTRREGAHDD